MANIEFDLLVYEVPNKYYFFLLQPVWLGWVSYHAARGRWFYFWSRHMTWWWDGYPLGGLQEATDWCFFSSSLSKIIKTNKQKNWGRKTLHFDMSFLFSEIQKTSDFKCCYGDYRRFIIIYLAKCVIKRKCTMCACFFVYLFS